MISACILTFNEEKNIQELINNIKDSVDEIVVIDNFSTDKTPEIVKNNSIQFIQRDSHNNFGDQRNYAIKQAKGEWVFMLDADERCSPKMLNSLQTLAKSTEYDGYAFHWRNYVDGKLVEIIYKTPTLFRRYGYYMHELHEKVQGLKKVLQIEDEEIYIDHQKTKNVQKEHLLKYKQIIQDNLNKYKKLGDTEKIKYYEEHLEKQKRKEKMWLNEELK